MREYKRPMYSQRHYEDVAHEIKYWHNGDERLTLAQFFLNLFGTDNDKFDPFRFLKAADLIGPGGTWEDVKKIKRGEELVV